MNDWTLDPEITFDERTEATEALPKEATEVQVLGYEDALSEREAAESSADPVEEPVFIELEEGQYLDIPLFITKTTARRFPGRRPGESLNDTLTRLARERQGE